MARTCKPHARVIAPRQNSECGIHRNSSGSLAIFAAIRLASSWVSNLAADRRPGSFFELDARELPAVVIADHEAGFLFFDDPGRREAAGDQSTRTSRNKNIYFVRPLRPSAAILSPRNRGVAFRNGSGSLAILAAILRALSVGNKHQG